MENVINITSKYYEWFDEICELAMRQEWCLENNENYWMPKFKKGLTVEKALDEYWKEFFPENS